MSLGEVLCHVITRINHECCQSETCAEPGQVTQRDCKSSSTCSKTSSFPQQEELVQWEEQGGCGEAGLGWEENNLEDISTFCGATNTGRARLI